MASETIVVTGTPKTLESNGASIANNALAQADDATYDIQTDGGGYPDAKFVIGLTFSVAPTENTTVALYARPLDIDGTADAEVPEASRPTVYIGSAVVNNVTTTQYHEINAQDVPWRADYYPHNAGTGQTIAAGWTLKVIPYTVKPAP